MQYKRYLRQNTQLKLKNPFFSGIISGRSTEYKHKRSILMDRAFVEIDDSYITLGQFLKLTDIISSGGMAKPFLQQMEVFVNDEPENRRGKKLYDGDVVTIPNIGEFEIRSLDENQL